MITVNQNQEKTNYTNIDERSFNLKRTFILPKTTVHFTSNELSFFYLAIQSSGLSFSFSFRN